MTTSASLSLCGRYRYHLARTWDSELPRLVFVMLNPSTADASEDDPTIRRCKRFADDRGYGGIEVVNLFAYRATDPQELPADLDIRIGSDNDKAIRSAASLADVVIAWGAHKAATTERVAHVMQILYGVASEIYCLGTTKSNAPRHPLYVRADQPLVPVWIPPAARRATEAV